MIEEDTRRAVARLRSEIWLWVLLDKYRAGLQLLSPQVCGKCFVIRIYSRAEEVMRECDTHHTRAIKTGSAVNLSRKPGLDLCCDLRQHLQGVPRTCRFYIIIRTYIDFARPIITHQIVFHMKCNNVTISNSRIIWMACFVQFYSILLTCNNIMYILPLPLCGLYSICAQNGYGPVSYTHLTLPTTPYV